MDAIPFEKVTVQEAKAAIDKPAPSEPARPEQNWTLAREKSVNNAELSARAWKWLDSLPPEIQPGGLVQRYPRIANKLADMWSRPYQCERYLDALLMDTRGGDRQGFPPDVAAEVAKLKIHYLSTEVIQRFDTWGQRIS